MALRFSLSERPAGSMSCPSYGSSISTSTEAITIIKQNIKAVHDADPNLDWVLLGYVGESVEEISLVAGGNAGSDEMLQYLDDNKILYGLVRVVDIVDNIPTHRFAHISWVGDHVSGVKKARTATNKGAILQIIGHYNVELVASSKEELTRETIFGKIQDASGTRIREIAVQQPIKRDSKSTVLPRAAVATANTSDSLISAEDQQYIFDVKSDATPTTWVLFSYTNIRQPQKVAFVASGTGNIEELALHFQPDQVHYAFLRTTDRVDESVTTKFIYLNWVGPNVSPMTKGKITTHKGSVESFFAPFTISMFGTLIDDFSVSALNAKLQQLKGAK
eukprot:TRINITY_DN1487_c0_g1_i1.p1 TRINITY_DN1487_c0_g1~~TRINITY_DN1487_c0_g1_i1.p1  ORF type:complete len:334 (+),score=173.54 TRINITY_DN1487_c0_g1_i1:94-1095(+)